MGYPFPSSPLRSAGIVTDPRNDLTPRNLPPIFMNLPDIPGPLEGVTPDPWGYGIRSLAYSTRIPLFSTTATFTIYSYWYLRYSKSEACDTSPTIDLHAIPNGTHSRFCISPKSTAGKPSLGTCSTVYMEVQRLSPQSEQPGAAQAASRLSGRVRIKVAR